MIGTFKIFVDQPQLRVKKDRLNLTVTGEELDQGEYSNTVVEPVNSFILLKPYRFDGDWFTSNSGNYEKFDKSDFSFRTGISTTTLVEVEVPAASAGKYLKTTGTSMVEIYTTTNLDKNQGITLTAFNYGSQETYSSTPILKCGWGTSLETSSLFFDLFPDGKIDLWVNGVLTKSDSISSESLNVSKNTTYNFFDLLVIPYNKNQILFWGLNGGSFVYTNPLILPSDTDAQITPNSRFFIRVPENRQAQFQFAPLRFYSSGSARSEKLNFIDPPSSGAVLESFYNDSWIGIQSYRIYGYPAYQGIQTASVNILNWSNSSFSANGINTEAKLQINLSTNTQSVTPTVVGAQIAYPSELAYTFNAKTDITEFSNNLEIDLPEDPFQSRVSFDVIEVDQAIGIVTNLQNSLNRPVQIEDPYGNPIFDGLITNLRLSKVGNALRLGVEAQTKLSLAENYLFRERVPLANEEFEAALGFCASRVGLLTTQIDIQSTSFNLPFEAAKNMSDWGDFCEIGDTAADKLRNITEKYAGTWIYGMDYQNVFVAGDKTYYTNSITLAESVGIASSLGIGTQNVWYKITQDLIDPEANDVRITWRSPKLDQIFQWHKADFASQDPTTAPGSRPDNWIGYAKNYGLIDPQITTPAAAQKAIDTIFDRLTRKRYLYEIDTNYLVNGVTPIWRGDTIVLSGIGSCRVSAINISVLKNNIAKASYTLEYDWDAN